MADRTNLAFLVILISCLCACSAFAQTGTITGVVSLPDTSVWSGITVTVLGQSKSAVTQPNGQFTLTNVGAGAVSVQAGKLYYVNARKDTVLSAGQTVTLSLSLARTVRDTMLVQQNGLFITGITNNGNIGALNRFVESGDPGFTWNGQQQLFEASLMLGTDTTRVSDAARFILGITQNNLDRDFQSLSDVVVLTQGADSSVYATAFDDSRANLPPGIPSQPLGLRVTQQTYSYGSAPNNSFLIVRMTLTNMSTVRVENLFVGWYFDWDVGPGPSTNRGETITRQNTIPGINGGLPFETEIACQRNASAGTVFMGIVPLSQAKFRASRAASNALEIFPDAPNRGLTEANKFRYMAFRRDTNSLSDWGIEEDLSTIVSVGGLAAGTYDSSSFSLTPGQSITVGFGVIGASDSPGFIQNALRCQAKWVELGNVLMLTSVAGWSEVPLENFKLEQNFPNPFNPSTTLRYVLPARGTVSIRVFNVLGEVVRTLLETVHPSGLFEVKWDGKDDRGSDVSTGSYFVRLTFAPLGATEVSVRDRKVLLLR